MDTSTIRSEMRERHQIISRFEAREDRNYASRCAAATPPVGDFRNLLRSHLDLLLDDARVAKISLLLRHPLQLLYDATTSRFMSFIRGSESSILTFHMFFRRSHFPRGRQLPLNCGGGKSTLFSTTLPRRYAPEICPVERTSPAQRSLTQSLRNPHIKHEFGGHFDYSVRQLMERVRLRSVHNV